MDKQVNILMLEDEPLDAELIWQMLGDGTFSFTGKLVDSRSAYCKELKSFSPDLILSDYSLPAFDGMEALKIVQREYPDIPFIFISGILGEDRAIETLKSGATDYILKDNLSRLNTAVERALSEAEERAKLQETEKALKDSEERYALAAKGANDGLWDWDLLTNKIYYSPRWKEMLGFQDDQMGTDPDEWLSRIHKEDFDSVNSALNKHKQGLISQFKCEYRILHKNGHYLWVLSRGVAVKNESGEAYRICGSQTDITQRKKAEEQLLFDAYHDSLTRLANRSSFLNHLEWSMERARRHKQYHFAVLMLDFDDFKIINDSLGHDVGDELLMAITKRLKECKFPGDTIARLGGDEFAILIDDFSNPEEIIGIVTKIRAKLANAFTIDGQEIYTTASIGIAHGSQEYKRPEDLLRDADTAMYRAKALGKAQHVIFNTDMHIHAKARLQLDMDLRRAFEHQEFQIHYQPIVSLNNGEITCFECLLRWQNPERGLIFPDRFVHILEETGMINELENWVLAEAGKQLKNWQGRFSQNSQMSISVNLSPKHILQSNLCKRIEQILKKNNLNPASFKLEITESLLMENPEAVIEILSELKTLGVLLLLDDFGTGYSSLSYLHKFPIDIVKIDRSFVSDMENSDKNLEIVRTIITLAKTLGKKVIAEGLETAQQLAILRDMKCDFGQGYYFSRPIDSANVELLLEKNPKW